MRRNRNGLTDGERGEKTGRRRASGCMKCLLMLVCFIVSPLVLHFFKKRKKKKKLSIDLDYDPRKVARDERKTRIAKNEKRQQQNHARAAGAAPPNPSMHQQRKSDIEKTLATTRISTASMGKFDKRLEGEKKLRGVKRKARRAWLTLLVLI